MKRKRIACALKGCSGKSTRPFCDEHMAMLDPTLRDRLMAAYLKTINGVGTSSEPLRIYSNTLESARKHITQKISDDQAPRHAQGVLL